MIDNDNLHFKIHFKGVESVFINPKQIYDINKKDDIIIKNKIESYAFNDRKEKDAIEKYNEYKSDIDELLLEEKEKQKIINSKEFSNILNNRNFFEYKENKNNQNEVEKTKKIKDINYLKQLAFENNSSENTEKKTINEIGEEKSEGTNNDYKYVKRKLPYFENEHQLRIGGKIYHMMTQMDKIAKEVLNKCNYYNYKK
jgi:hypothetical protein